MKLVKSPWVWGHTFKLCSVVFFCLPGLAAAAKSLSEPEIARQEGIEPRIDSENFEIGVSLGGLSLEDFGVNPYFSTYLAYHLTENYFFELSWSSSEGSKTSFETLNAVDILTDDQRGFTSYAAHVGWHILPGESFVTDHWTLTSQVYVTFGLGAVDFAGESSELLELGLGYRALLNDWLALRLQFSDSVFDVDILGPSRQTHNFSMVTGLSFFF